MVYQLDSQSSSFYKIFYQKLHEHCPFKIYNKSSEKVKQVKKEENDDMFAKLLNQLLGNIKNDLNDSFGGTKVQVMISEDENFSNAKLYSKIMDLEDFLTYDGVMVLYIA